MPQETAARPRPKTIKVTVTFPISSAGPFRDERASTETVEAVREAAMKHFAVAADGQHNYYLTHAGKRAADGQTIGEIAGHAAAAKFTLVKELVQG